MSFMQCLQTIPLAHRSRREIESSESHSHGRTRWHRDCKHHLWVADPAVYKFLPSTASETGTSTANSSPLDPNETRGALPSSSVMSCIPNPFSVGGSTNGPPRSTQENFNT